MQSQKVLKDLGEKCKALRIRKGLTQSQLAHKINKDRESISRLERGKINPTYLYLLEVSNGLDLDIKELV